MEELKPSRFPEGVQYKIVYDTTPFINESIVEVLEDAPRRGAPGGPGGAGLPAELAGGVIPLMAVPVAIVGTFAVMAAMGFSLNNLSLFGLVLAIGIVVDDAIVVVENVERWLAEGCRRARPPSRRWTKSPGR